MNRHTRIIAGAALAAAITAGSIAPSPAAAAGVKRLVDQGMDNCPGATYTDIGTAIADAGPGDTITVCAGDYTEQLVIASKPGLKLIGKGMPRISGPTNTNGAIILVSNSLNVTIEGLTIHGAWGFSASSTSMSGIEFNNSTGTIRKNFINRIRRSPMDGAQQGDAILVIGSPAPTPQPVKILNNTINDYQHAGIMVQGNYKPTITRNLIQTTSAAGSNPTGILLQLVDGGSVSSNVIANDWREALYYYPSTGIYLWGSSHVKVASNTVRASRLGVLAESAGSPSDANTITGNRILDSYQGVLLFGSDSNGNIVKGNKVISTVYWVTFGSGIGVEGGAMAVGNKVIGNTIQGYAFPGYEDNGTGTIISGNKWAKLPAPGS